MSIDNDGEYKSYSLLDDDDDRSERIMRIHENAKNIHQISASMNDMVHSQDSVLDDIVKKHENTAENTSKAHSEIFMLRDRVVGKRKRKMYCLLLLIVFLIVVLSYYIVNIII